MHRTLKRNLFVQSAQKKCFPVILEHRPIFLKDDSTFIPKISLNFPFPKIIQIKNALHPSFEMGNESPPPLPSPFPNSHLKKIASINFKKGRGGLLSAEAEVESPL